MRSSDPKSLALFNASVITLICAAISVLWGIFTTGVDFIHLLVTAILLFVSAYLIISYTVDRFIYDRIRLIYKTIRKMKTPGSYEKRRTRVGTEMIREVDKEVIEWERRQKDEINRLKELENYRREFLGNISHELKTPIFNIQGYILTLLDGGLDDPTINKTYLKRTEKSINRMIAIVEDLETISQMESGEMTLNIKKFDLVALTHDVVEFLEMKARKRNVELYFREQYDRPIWVMGDHKRIRQVLINLIDNAIKYGHKDEGARTKISFFDMDENILVEVTDNGEGISPQDLPRIFERFYRTDKARSRDQGGTGLGLSIVKHIIEAHDQTINVRSTVGVGTTFAFTLQKAK